MIRQRANLGKKDHDHPYLQLLSGGGARENQQHENRSLSGGGEKKPVQVQESPWEIGSKDGKTRAIGEGCG